MRRGKVIGIYFPDRDRKLYLRLKRKHRPSGISRSKMIIEILRKELDEVEKEPT